MIEVDQAVDLVRINCHSLDSFPELEVLGSLYFRDDLFGDSNEPN